MRYVLLCFLTLSGCAASRTTAPESSASEGDAPSLGEDHPLTGKIFDARDGQFVSLEEALESARRARYLLLGEKHDNPAHHEGQATLLAARAETSQPALVWEMITEAQEFSGPVYTGTAEEFAQELDWAHSGWPPFEMYRPIARVAIARELPQYAGNLDREAMRTAYTEGLEGLDSSRAQALGVRERLTGDALEALRQDIARGHCGFGDAAMLDSMAAAQQSRDAFMAAALVQHDDGEGAVLVAGGGHVRRDRAVPFHLRAHGVAEEDVRVVTWAEVRDDATDPRAYQGGETPAFDLVFFTPRMSNEDPCDTFAEQVERIRAQERDSESERDPDGETP